MSAREIALGALPLGSERVLLEGCRDGNPEAFARLVALHERMVLNLAYRLLGDFEEARDVSQDVFLHAYKMLGRFEGRSRLRTWLYTIVLNLCRNRRRSWLRHRRRETLPLEDLAPSDAARLTSSEPNPETCLERRELHERVQQALLRISFEHRAILLLREAEDLSCAQIASTLSIREGTVKSRLARARDALRRELEPMLKEGDCP